MQSINQMISHGVFVPFEDYSVRFFVLAVWFAEDSYLLVCYAVSTGNFSHFEVSEYKNLKFHTEVISITRVCSLAGGY